MRKWGGGIVGRGQFVAGSIWAHLLETNVIFTLDCLQTVLWVITFINNLGSLIYNNSITSLPPIPLYSPLLAQCHPCPTWPPAFPLMLTLQTLLKHDIRDLRLYKFQMSCSFSNVYIIIKKKVMRISRQPSPVTIMIDQKQLQNVECF